ncbi:MAG TPA: cytochrome c oxidase assembly protein, partial [Acetobacteraceae bacterium]|nr:cytochrome c oxidase assembly protein [Acetobacteraceae bacterium]
MAPPATPEETGCRPLPLVSLGECGIVALTIMAGWVTARFPSALPAWAPWDFSWTAFLATGLALLWFLRGLARTPHAQRIAAWRCLCFLSGLAGFYAVLLTHFEYLAQHAFFLNRVQHVAMHHLCPFLIALSWPGETMARGMPPRLLRALSSTPVHRLLRVLQNPWLAYILFEGLLLLWLVPPVTFAAMIDPHLFAVMNASMVIDGLLFWFLVLDPRPPEQAPLRFFTRLLLGFVVIFPQIAAGTVIGGARHDLYPSFALCGRVYTSIGPLLDQQIGGLILWVPAGMM